MIKFTLVDKMCMKIRLCITLNIEGNDKMKYKIIFQMYTLFIGLIASGIFIYIGIKQVKRKPFIVRGVSRRAGIVLPGLMITIIHAIEMEFQIFFSLISL